MTGTRRGPRVASAAGTLAVVAGTGVLALTAGASATAARHMHARDIAEAWYATTPVSSCTSPLGCAPSDALS